MPSVGEQGRRGGGRGERGLLSASAFWIEGPRGLQLITLSGGKGKGEGTSSHSERKKRVYLCKEGKNGRGKGRKESRRVTRRGREERNGEGKEGQLQRNGRQREGREETGKRKRRRGRGEKKERRPSIRMHSPSNLGERGKSRTSRARRQRALPPRVDHGHISAGAELGGRSSGQVAEAEGGKEFRPTFLLSCGIWNC